MVSVLPVSKATKSHRAIALTTNSVQCYLHTIGRIPLLPPDAEITLGQQVQQMMVLFAVKDALSESLGQVPSLPR